MQKSKDGQEVVLKGLALPADAMSWLSYAFEEIRQFEEVQAQGKDDDSSGDEDYDCDDNISDCVSVKSRYSASANNMLSGMGLTDPHLIEKYAHRLSLLRDKFLPRATHVRITDEPWPSRTKVSSKRSSSTVCVATPPVSRALSWPPFSLRMFILASCLCVPTINSSSKSLK